MGDRKERNLRHFFFLEARKSIPLFVSKIQNFQTEGGIEGEMEGR